jgi:hypothetical protein
MGYLPDLVQLIKARYSFVSVPSDADLVPSDPPKGAEFKLGKLVVEGRVVVFDRVTIFSDGVVVDAASSTSDADLFLDDLAEWARSILPQVELVGPRYYLSQLEVHLDSALEEPVPVFKPVGEKVSSLLQTYGISVPRYEVASVHWHCDQLGKNPPQPAAFFIERRANIPYNESVWFAQAPLRTEDHKTMLEEFERLR